MTPEPRFEDAARDFAADVAASFALSGAVRAQPEDQLKAPVGDFLRAAGTAWGIEAASLTEARAPGDIGRHVGSAVANFALRCS